MLYLGQGQIEPESYTSNAEEEEAWQALEERMDIIGQNGATGEHYGEPMDDNCPAARIGELGNQVHNLGCDYQNDEDLSDELGQVAVTLWDLAKKAGTRTDAQIEWDGTGLPPCGTICECLFNDGWVKVVVLSVNGDEAWVCRPRGSHIVSKGLGNEFRPIRTQAQIDRALLTETLNCMRKETDVGVIADAIIEMGFRITKP